MDANEMDQTVKALLAPGKGLLAADESFPSIEKRFAAISLPSSEENRRAYREMLFTTPDLGQFISGVILFDETLRQEARDGVPFAEVLAKQQMIPGIKVDAGTIHLPGFPGEKITAGLDGLPARLQEYHDMGARFTKWRAVISIGEQLPTQACLNTNARLLAIFAAMCQAASLVPIVEPEVLMDGEHSLTRCEEVIGLTLTALFDALAEQRVTLERMILKSGMVLSGAASKDQTDDTAVAEATLRCFRRTVPAAVPGIVFLSGGQEDIPATRRLNEIAKANPGPWTITFSYGRALQNPSLQAWHGLAGNVAAGQKALYHRSLCNGKAALGEYSDSLERQP